MKRLALQNQKAWVEEAEMPRAKGESVVVKLEATPICGSDKKHFLSKETIRYAGHEGTGVVIEVDQSSFLQVGDRVLTNCLSGCGVCQYCRGGNYVYCDHMHPFDQHASHFAQYTSLQDFLCLPLPEDIPFDLGALAGCALAPSFNTLNKMALKPKDLVMVTGCGPVGLGAIVIAKHYNAQVIAVEVSSYRKELAAKLGADYVVDGKADPLLEAVLETTGGQQPNKIVETSGMSMLQEFAFKAVDKLGHVGFVGHNPNPITLMPNDMIFKGLKLYGSWHVNLNDITDKIYDIIRRAPGVKKLITHSFSLEQAQDAFDTFMSGESGKIMFHPWA